MEKLTLMKKLEALVDEAIRTRLWGDINISFQGGVPNTLKKVSTERLINNFRGGNPNGRPEDER
jgi:hypothetical protein